MIAHIRRYPFALSTALTAPALEAGCLDRFTLDRVRRARGPRIIIRTTELRIGPFARDEGEDGLSLESWQQEHRRNWTRVSAAQGRTWSEDDEIGFERFSVVWPPEIAD